MTERLYYTDSYLREFPARVVERSADGQTVYLDRTAFYPTSGGQPFDLGSIAGVAVIEVVDEEDRIAHRLRGAAGPRAERSIAPRSIGRGASITCSSTPGSTCSPRSSRSCSNCTRSASTSAPRASTIDLEGGAVDARTLLAAELRANELIYENRPLDVRFEDATEAQGLRKASEREGTLRIVSIEGLDRSACGGTHVRGTGEIGAILLRKLEKIRQSVRVEFVCGARAVRRARADFEALTKVSQVFSAALDDVPSMVAAQVEAAKAGERARRKVELELAAYQGRELYQNTAPGTDGLRRVTPAAGARQSGRPARRGAELHGAADERIPGDAERSAFGPAGGFRRFRGGRGQGAEGGTDGGRRTRRRQRAHRAGQRAGHRRARRVAHRGVGLTNCLCAFSHTTINTRFTSQSTAIRPGR